MKNIFKLKYEAIRKDIKYCDKSFAFKSLEHSERVKCVKQFLKAIVGRVGCNDYLFTLGITELDERYGKTIVPELWEILDIYFTYSDKINLDISCNDAFAAFYCLVHHYYRAFNIDVLKRLLMPKDDLVQKFKDSNEVAVEKMNFFAISNSAYNKIFIDYPLIFELLARYYAVLGDYNSQLKMAKTALKKLAGTEHIKIFYNDEEPYEQQGENYGVKISCAGAVCSVLENNYLYGVLSEVPTAKLKGQGKTIKSTAIRNSSLSKADMSAAVDFIGDDSIAVTEQYIDSAMNFAANVLACDYPKYHFLKAKIKFYSAVLENYLEGNVQRPLKDKCEIESELDKAIFLEESRASHDVEKRTYIYTCLKEQVIRYTEANLDKKYHKARKDIISAESLQKLNDEAYPALKENITGDYVFVSYSSADFKPVYCDLLEMNRKGINYWYDRGTCLGVDWKEIVRQRIEGCSAVLYYMSAQSVASMAVLEELNYILQLKKPIICINLCGNNLTSKTLIDIIRGGSDKAINSITSNTLKTICTACPDYIVMLQHDRDPLNVYHIKKLRNDLLKTFPSTIRYVESESAILVGSDKTFETMEGTIAVRPNEDYLICDEVNKIYIVADGISRSQEEYKKYLQGGEKTVAGKVCEIFCDTMHGLIKELLLNVQSNENLKHDFEIAFKTANKRVEKFLNNYNDYFYTPDNNGVKYYEKPGCVAIVAFIFGGRLYFGAVGDCMGILLRGGKRIIFSDKQTDYAFTQMNVEQDRYKLYCEYVNKPNNPYGYGVINGDKNASNFFNVSHLELEAGDEIYIVSDGLSDLIKYCEPTEISKLSLSELMKKEDDRRAALNRRNDDKAVIRIKIN